MASEVISQTGWASLRAIIIATLAILTAAPVRDLLRGPFPVRWKGTLAWSLLLAPFLAPGLLVGYAYAPFALALVRTPAWDAAFHGALLWLRLTPLAVLALVLRPPALSAEGSHCFQLLPNRPGRAAMWWFRLRGAGRAPWIALALVFLFAFGEFEMTSLWGVKSWTVVIFDAQAGGLELPASLRLAVVPALVQAAALWPALGLLTGSRAAPIDTGQGRLSPSRDGRVIAWAYLWLAALFAAVIPVLRVLKEAALGMPRLFESFTLSREIGISVGMAVLAAMAVWFAASRVPRYPLLAALLAIPGLAGGLLLSLGMVALFQRPGFHVFYDTPLPWLLALILLILPFGLLLAKLRHATRPAAAWHAAVMLGDRRLRWELSGRANFWAAFALYSIAYCDLTTGAMLAPVGLTPVFVRLYNLMHYGQGAVLSAMICAAYAVPACIALGMAAILRGGAPRRE